MRALTDVERRILARMLTADFEGVERLRMQAQQVLGASATTRDGYRESFDTEGILIDRVRIR